MVCWKAKNIQTKRDDVMREREREFWNNPEVYDKFEDDYSKTFGDHLSKCSDSDCQRLRDNWLSLSDLSKYIH